VAKKDADQEVFVSRSDDGAASPAYKIVGDEDSSSSDSDTDEKVVETKADDQPVQKEAKEDVPKYEPSYKYKANDEEKDFPEYLKGVVTSKEVEDQLRDILSRADGLPALKEHLASKSKEYDSLNGTYAQKEAEYNNLVKGLESLQHFADTDLETFIDKTKIDKNKVISLVRQWLEDEANPSQASQRQVSRTNNLNAYNYQNQNQQLQQQNQQLLRQQYVNILDNTMMQPGISDFAKEFDTRAGRLGAFKEQVDQMWMRDDSLKHPQDAALKTIEFYKPLIGYGQQQQVSQPVVQQSAPQPKSIPNFGQGRSSASPTKKSFRSLDEITKLYKEKYQSE
jgi:hypothetical protein